MNATFDFYQSGRGSPYGSSGFYSQMAAQAPARPEPEDVEWADYAKSIMAGGAGIVQSVGWLADTLGAEEIGTSIEELGRDAVDYWHDSLSDPAKAELAKQIIRKNEQTGEYEWGDPSFSTVGLMGAQSLLGTAAGMGIGAGLTKVLQVFANPFGRNVLVRAAQANAAKPGLVGGGVSQAAKKLKLVDTVLGATGFGIGEGSIGGISAGSSVYDNVMNLPVEKLMENERYQQVYNSTDSSISELERHQYAADTVAKEASTAAGFQSGLTTALLGAPMGAYFGRILGGAKLQTTIPKAIAVGAAGEAAQEFAQSGVEQIISNYQTGKYDPDVDLWDDVLNAAVSGAAAGGLLGGLVGPAAVKGSRVEVQMEQQEASQDRLRTLKTIGGPVGQAAERAADAKVEAPAIAAIVQDWVDGRIDQSRALDSLEALTEARTLAEETGEQVEVETAQPAPPPTPAEEAAAQAPSEDAQEAQKEPEPEVEKKAQGPEAVQEGPAEAIPESAAAPELEMVNPLELQVDAGTFQFKAQTDTEGVSKRLKGVRKFDKLKAGTAIVYEDMNGDRFIVDGHQRVNLAKRAIEAGQDPAEVQLPAYVLKASEGVTPEEATFVAATKNIAEGSGSAIDAAKILRERSEEVEQELPNLPPTSALVKQAKGLRNLDDEAFAKAVNEIVPERQAAIVGEMIPADADLQNAAIEVLRQTQPANDTQARAVVDQVRTAGVEVQETTDLFGEQAIAESLYLERAKVLDAAMRTARRNKATFRTLMNRQNIITQTGENVLDTEANLAAMTEAEQAVSMLSTLANQTGPISNALTEAAREVKAGAKPGTVAQGFLETALREIQTTGPAGRVAGEAAAGTARPEIGPGLEPAAEALFSRSGNVDPTGHCFENCGRFMMNNGASRPGLRLMHGYVTGQGPIEGVRFAHAWLEEIDPAVADNPALAELSQQDADMMGRTAMDLTTDDRVENPVELPAILYRSLGEAEVLHEYTYDEALRWMAKEHHWGPWEMEEHPDAAAIRTEPLEQPAEAEEDLQSLADEVFMTDAEQRQQDLREEEERRDRARNTGQMDLFSRRGRPLSEIRLSREFEVEETGEIVEVDYSAAVMLRRLDKRIDMMERLRACVRG